MNLTGEQRDIIESFGSEKRVLVNALAGTGKTSTAIECIRSSPHLKGLYLCFNKSIADEMNAKLHNMGIGNVAAQTIHSFALNIIRNSLGQRNVDDHAAYDYIATFCEFRRGKNSFFSDRFDLCRLRSLARDYISAWCHSSFLSFNDFIQNHNHKATYAQLRNLNADVEYFHSQLGNFWERISTDTSLPIAHDIYLKIFHLNFREIVKYFNYDFIIADEAQDLFPVAEDIINVFHENGVKTLCLGDRYQQIYAWNKSVNTMKRLEKDSVSLNLTQSFRCSQNVVDTALPWLRLLGYRGNFSARNRDDIAVQYQFASLSRTVCGVFDILRQCMESGLESGDIYLVGGGSSYDFSIIQDRLHFMANRRNRIKNRNMRQCANDQAYDRLAMSLGDNEMIKAKAICSRLGYEKTQKLLNLVNGGNFAGPNAEPQIVVSTGHKAKGMEFSHVILENFGNFVNDNVWESGKKYRSPMFSSRIPSAGEIDEYEKCEFAVRNAKNMGNEYPFYVNAEELRLNYVAITRAIDTINPGQLDLSRDDTYAKALRLIKSKRVILTDRDVTGNITLYDY